MLCMAVGLFVACEDSETYADIVDAEKKYISNFVKDQNISAIHWNEDKVEEVTRQVLNDSIDPATLIDLDQWYYVTEGDFKRLYFKIKNWGNRYPDFESGKFRSGSQALVRYDSCYNLNNYVSLEEGKGSNLDPNSYEIIYSWSTEYYASSYYGYYYGTGSDYECTSGGLGFPLRFLWEGGEAALIVPFSLGSSMDQSYYYTIYYGSVKYSRPNHLP